MDKAMNLIQDADLYADVQTEPSTEKSQYIILEPRNQIISHTKGIDLQKLAASARVALAGRRVIQMTHKDEPMDIELEYPKNHFQNDDDVQNFLISTPYGGVPFKHFFEFSRTEGITEIIKNGEDKVFQVVAKLKESTPPWQRDLLEDKSKALLEEKLVMPAGYSFQFQDTQEAINTATVGLLIALGISVFLIYVILGIQFNSLFEPLVILMAIPLGLIGVVTSLYVFDSTLSLNSMLGTILLGGIAVNNSILIFDFFKQFRGEFETKKEALIHACSLRITPIMITTLTTILGMMPLAMAMGEGTNVIQPLGIAVSGGLGVSSLMTVFVIPCMLYLLPERQQEVRRA
jgi:HAE1 family hydrophobic/amphiphilic exporter-1